MNKIEKSYKQLKTVCRGDQIGTCLFSHSSKTQCADFLNTVGSMQGIL